MEGKCYFCNKQITNRSAKRHILTCENRKNIVEKSVKKAKNTKEQFILKIVDKYNPSTYYIYIDIDVNLTLRVLDTFLRDVWMECCGHLSKFNIDGITYACDGALEETFYGEEESFDVLLKEVLYSNSKIKYSYDFESTSEVVIEVVDKIETAENSSSIEILARNNEVKDDEEYEGYEGYTNSPRDGVCGYVGAKDNEEKYLPGNKTEIEINKNLVNSSVQKVDDYSEEEISELMNEFISEKVEKTAKIAMKRECSNDLKELLKVETKDTLKELMNALNIPYKSTDKKETLIDKISIDYKEAISDILGYASGDCYNYLQIILKNNGIISLSGDMENSESFIFLEEIGIVYIAEKDDELYLCAPQEVLQVITEIDRETIDKNDEILKLFRGMLYYYGSISIEDFIERLPEEIKIDLELEELDMILAIGERTYADYIYEDGFGVNPVIADTTELEALQSMSEKENYKICTKNELLKAGRRNYIGDKSSYKPFIKFIKDNYTIPGDDLDGLIEFLYETYQLDGRDKLIESVLEQLSPPEYLEGEIIKALDETFRKIPVWRYNGYTEAEKNNSTKVNIEKIKIGRNDPCPCGSGKKYKKCCEAKG